MKKAKRISVVAMLLVVGLVFTGCTNGELKLYNSFLKSQDIRAMESKTDLTFKLEGEGLSEETEKMLKEASTFLNTYKLTMNQKMERNEDGTVAKAQVDSEMDMGGIKTNLSVWLDVDVSKDIPKMKYIIKMPQMLMSMAGEEFANKEYIEYDYNEVLGSQDMDINYKELMKWSKEMEPKMREFFAEYVKNFDTDVKMVKYKGQRSIDSEMLQIYELKLNDESFKKLMRKTINDFVQNEDMKKFMTEYINMMVSVVESQNPGDKKEINKEIEELKKEIPNIKENFNKFMDEFDKIKVLAEEGIRIEYGINKEGYIISEKGSINLMLDLEKLGNKVNESNKEEVKAPEMKGIIRLKMNFDTKNSNINKSIKIETPKLTKENSLKFSDILKLEP